MIKGKIHSIETFGTVDGPGVRFVVFFQGCPMRCLYCHNPDTWHLSDFQAEYSAGELIEKMKRNLPFYKTGGITATGGEPLMQIEFLTELFRLAKDEGIHTCLDTSGITFSEDSETLSKFDTLIGLTDLVMLDIKHIDSEKHKELTGKSNEAPLSFANYLRKRGTLMRVRHVLIPGYTDAPEQLRARRISSPVWQPRKNRGASLPRAWTCKISKSRYSLPARRRSAYDREGRRACA